MNFIMVALNLYISLGRTDILTIHGYGISLHLLNAFQQRFVISVIEFLNTFH